MNAQPWTPWHKVVKLREDVRNDELSIFAADLYDGVMGQARPVYQDASDFCTLTCSTVTLRDPARDVALRLDVTTRERIRRRVVGPSDDNAASEA